MASFMLFQINKDLFNTKKGKIDTIDLEVIVQKMSEALIIVDPDTQAVNSSGFHNISVKNYEKPSFQFNPVNDLVETDEPLFNVEIDTNVNNTIVQMISAEVTGLGSLGRFHQAYINSEGTLESVSDQQKFYTNASVKILEDGWLLVFFEKTSSEKIKGEIITLFEEEIGLEVIPFRITSDLLTKVRLHTDWQNIKIDQIKNDSDRTTAVHYEVDLSNQTDPAIIHDLYKDKGKIVQLTSAVPYRPILEDSLQPSSFTINLYQVGHRFSILDAQFNNNYSEMKAFALHFTALLKQIIER